MENRILDTNIIISGTDKFFNLIKKDNFFDFYNFLDIKSGKFYKKEYTKWILSKIFYKEIGIKPIMKLYNDISIEPLPIDIIENSLIMEITLCGGGGGGENNINGGGGGGSGNRKTFYLNTLNKYSYICSDESKPDNDGGNTYFYINNKLYEYVSGGKKGENGNGGSGTFGGGGTYGKNGESNGSSYVYYNHGQNGFNGNYGYGGDINYGSGGNGGNNINPALSGNKGFVCIIYHF